MSDEILTDRLPGALADVPVGAPPLDRMHADARRIRRGRRAAGTAVAAVVLVVGGVTVWSAVARDDAAREIGPATTEVVGLDDVRVAVPESWVRDDGPPTDHCGAENPDVVVYHAPDCGPGRQDTVHLVRSERAAPPAGIDGEEIEIDGVPAYRSTVRSRFADPDDGEPTVWVGEVYVDGVVVSALSSIGPDVVEELLDSVALE
jgi:hypothetical protein